MASKGGAVTLRGRFSPGTDVQLVKVKSEAVLRSEGGDVLDDGTVDDDGSVTLSGLGKGERGFIRGYDRGEFREVRVTGRDDADDSALAQAPVTPDRVRLRDGSWADERPEREDPGFGGVGPAPGQHQVPEGTPQRSDTGRGSAHPVDPGELAPYPSQSDVDDDTPQRSSTEHGQATPIAHDAPLSQEDVKAGTLQRSDTPLGTATPIPDGNAVEAQEAREASETKAAVGEPVKAAAAPVDHAKGRPAKKATAKKQAAKPKPAAKEAASKPAAKPSASSSTTSNGDSRKGN